MKNNKALKLTLIILVCVLVIMVGFAGIFVKNMNAYQNILPKYALATDLKGATSLEFEVDTSNETTYYDKEGNEVDSADVTDENKDDYTTEEKPVNATEVLTTENYKKVVDIMEKRLQFLKTDQYRLDLDEKTGKIVLVFEDDYHEDVESILPMTADLNLVDSTTEEVILGTGDFTSAEASYASTDDGYTAYLSLKLNQTGIDKINDIDKYKVVENTEENVADNTVKNTETNTEDSTDNAEDTKNKLKVMFDSDEIAEISYDDLLLTGKTLRITTDSNLTSNSTIQSALNTNTVIAKLATIGKQPVVYKLSAEEYIKSNITNNITYIVMGIGVIVLLISLYFIIKYKGAGLLATLGTIASIALFLIIIRLTNVEISLNGFAGMILLILLNTILVRNILNNIQNKDRVFSENIKKAYMQSLDALVVTVIIFVVFAFSTMTVINSMGLLVFWGWLAIVLGNLVFTVPMLSLIKE